jgi:hypothetical protein
MLRYVLPTSALLVALVGCDGKNTHYVSSSSATAKAGPSATASSSAIASPGATVSVSATASASVTTSPTLTLKVDAPEVVLFNGKDLTGWVVTECETEVKDGVLLLKAGEGWVRAEKKYGDFSLSWECKNIKPTDYDSGVHFRAELQKPPAHWPTKYQVNLKTGLEGNVKPLNAASTGLYKNGEWNAFKLTVVGSKAELEINGKPAWQADGVEAADGYIGLQSEVTLGGQFEFRNIKIKVAPKS